MRTTDTIWEPSEYPVGDRGRRSGILARVFNWMIGRIELRRTRLDLLDMSDDQLRDIGLTLGQATREANLPWWR